MSDWSDLLVIQQLGIILAISSALLWVIAIYYAHKAFYTRFRGSYEAKFIMICCVCQAVGWGVFNLLARFAQDASLEMRTVIGIVGLSVQIFGVILFILALRSLGRRL